MRSLKIGSFQIRPSSDGVFDEGGPARRLRSAVAAVIEPVEARLMMSASPAPAVASISARFETQNVAHKGDAADDAAVWVNPTDASRSTIIGTDKRGGLNVYDFAGNQLQSITDASYNNVDVRGDVVAASNISTNSISFFKVDAATRKLTDVTAGNTALGIGGRIYGLTMYRSADTGKTFVFVSNRTGGVEQFELTTNSAGDIAAHSVRKLQLFSVVEGMVADDDAGAIYVAQEDVAIWKYGAEPADGVVRVQVDRVGSGGQLSADIEGLALYKSANGTGYLIASSQGSNDFVVYDRQSGAYVTRFKIGAGSVDGVSGTDGIEAVNVNLGSNLPAGAFIAQDDRNDSGNQNFKIVSWADIAASQSLPLSIQSASNPQSLTTPILNSNVTAAVQTNRAQPTQAPSASESNLIGVAGLALFDSSTGQVLRTLADGDTLDLADFRNARLNVQALTTPAKVGSVRFGLDGNDKFKIENYSLYALVGDKGTWSPNVGEHTITATAYTRLRAGGEAGGSVTVRFTLIDSGGTTPSSTTTAPPAVVVEPTPQPEPVVVVLPAIPSTPVVTPTAIETPMQANGDRPSPANTGVAKGITLTKVSGFTAASNTVYENLYITGMVDARGVKNTIFRNCIFDGGRTMSNEGSQWAVRCDGAASVTVENCELRFVSSSAIYGDNFRAINNYVHHTGGDGFKAGNGVLIQGNYVAQLGWGSPNAHSDGIQIRGSKNIDIVGNYFDMPVDVAGFKSNAVLFVQGGSDGPAGNINFTGNWCKGGNYTIRAYTDGGNASSICIKGNYFWANQARYGIANNEDGVIWQGNTVADTGATALASMK